MRKLNQKKIQNSVKRFCIQRNLKVPKIGYSRKRCLHATKDKIYISRGKSSEEYLKQVLKLYESIHRERECFDEAFIKYLEHEAVVEDVLEFGYVESTVSRKRYLKIKVDSLDGDPGCNQIILLDVEGRKIYHTDEGEYFQVALGQ